MEAEENIRQINLRFSPWFFFDLFTFWPLTWKTYKNLMNFDRFGFRKKKHIVGSTVLRRLCHRSMCFINACKWHFESKTTLFSCFTKVQLLHKTSMDFNVFDLRKNIFSKTSFFFCSTYNHFWLAGAKVVLRLRWFCSWFLTPRFACLYLARCSAQKKSDEIFSTFFETYYKTPVSLRILTKRRVRLRCRCSCEIDGTSAVPFAKNLETSVILS